MSYGLTQLTFPASLPIDLPTFKAQTRVNVNQEDSLLTHYLTAACEMWQNMSKTQLLSTQFKMTLDSFTGWDFLSLYGWNVPGFACNIGEVIFLPRPPLISVQSIRYFDNSWQTWDAANYSVDNTRHPGRITAIESFPSANPPGIEITFTTGYASSALIPALVKQAIMLLAAHWYNQRAEVNKDNYQNQIPNGFASIARQYKPYIMYSGRT